VSASGPPCRESFAGLAVVGGGVLAHADWVGARRVTDAVESVSAANRVGIAGRRAGTGSQRVAAGTAEQRVIALLLRGLNHPKGRFGADCVIARPAVLDIGANSADDAVRTVAGTELVVAAAAAELIVAGAAVGVVRAAAAEDRVVAGATRQLVRIRTGVGVLQRRTVEQVVPAAAVEGVGTRASIEPLRGGAPAQDVVAVLTEEFPTDAGLVRDLVVAVASAEVELGDRGRGTRSRVRRDRGAISEWG
jgi:hypothetical protein